jgi:NADH:ubiquinone oxidoreductase subunit 6 (subunit J)
MSLPEFSPVLLNIAFWGLSGLTVLSALGVVFHRSIVYSALLLLVCFLSIAGLFVTLNAPFIAAAEILVYAVGLTIVMIFGVMLTGDVAPESLSGAPRVSAMTRVVSIIAALLMFDFLLVGVFNFPQLDLGAPAGPLFRAVNQTPEVLATLPGAQSIVADGGIGQIATLLFNQYVIPFEVASVLLLLAMVGAILLSKRILPEEEGYSEASLTLDASLASTVQPEAGTSSSSPSELVGAR